METRILPDFKFEAEKVKRRFVRQDGPVFALAVAEGRPGLGIAAC
jgi:hypothetical protein